MWRSIAAALAACGGIVAAPIWAAPHGCHHDVEHGHDLASFLEHEALEKGFEALLERYPDLATRFPGLISPYASSQFALAGAASSSVYVPCVPGSVEPFPGWFSGDTHNHVQTCDLEVIEVDELHAGMVEQDLDVTTPLIWGPHIVEDASVAVLANPDVYWNTYVLPNVTGAEAEFTVDKPEIVQFGIEASGFTVGHWGHLTGLNVDIDGASIHWKSYPNTEDPWLWMPPYENKPFNWFAFTRAVECGYEPAEDDGYKDDGTGFWSVPVLDEFRESSGVVTGYAHQAWPTGLFLEKEAGGWDWEAAALAGLDTPIGADLKSDEAIGKNLAFPNNFEGPWNIIYPVLMPMDVAMRQVDFLEAWDMQHDETGVISEVELCDAADADSGYVPCGVENPETTSIADAWHGAYYKLLSAGQRVGISGGTDANCAAQLCFPRTHVQMGQPESPSYTDWVTSLQAGRVVVATEAFHFLEVTVDGASPGAQLEVETPEDGVARVMVEYSYVVDPAALDFFQAIDATVPGHLDENLTLQVVQDGEVVASHTLAPEDFENGAPYSGSFEVDVTRSGWLAVKTQAETIHTGAFYAILDGRPIAHREEAEYWALYCDYVLAKIEGYARCAAPGAIVEGQAYPEFLQEHVGQQRGEIDQHVREARQVFAAVRDYDTPMPGVAHHYRSSPPPCTTNLGNVTRAPMAAGVNRSPVTGSPVTVHCFNAPPGTRGWLLVGSEANFIDDEDQPLEVSGADLYLIEPLVIPMARPANSGGYAEVHFPTLLPESVEGTSFYFQFIWQNTEGCAGDGTWSTSDVLELTAVAPGAE